MRTQLLFAVGPYAAAALFAAGLLLRFLAPPSTRNDHRPAPRLALLVAALSLLLLAHLAGLALPQSVLRWNRLPLRLYVLEGALLLTGLTAFLASCDALRRLIRRAEMPPAAIADSIGLALICTVTASGLAVAGIYRWASSWGVAVMSPYAVSLLRLAPKEALFDSMPFAVRLHVASSFALLAVLPLTTAGRIAVAAARRRAALAAAFAGSRLIVVAAALRAWIERRGIAARLWPEEED